MMLISCGDESAYSNRPTQLETTPISFTEFDTRLSNNLRISGTQCFGGEVVDYGGRTYICERENWLVVIDNINTCSAEGCTEVKVQPVTASLNVFSGDSSTAIYEITPAFELSPEQEEILEGVGVRTRENTEPTVVYR